MHSLHRKADYACADIIGRAFNVPKGRWGKGKQLCVTRQQ